MTTSAPAKRELRRVANLVDRSEAARIVARAGLVARALFYLVLASLVVRVAVEGAGSGPQANPNGALSFVAGDWAGMAAIGAAALGFLVFGVVRVAGAVRDERASRGKRALTLVQGLFYVALAWVPLSFLLGQRQTGSEQAQQGQAERLFGWPGGRELLAALGLIVVGVCVFQIREAVSQNFADGLNLRRAPRWARRLVEVAGTVGIVSRALVFVPIGVLLVVAAVQADPAHAKGLDGELATLAGKSWWGPGILGVVAAGLAVFALYSGLEATFRRVERA